MHPVKGRAVIKSAYTIYGVRHFVVDHMNELEKLVEETAAQDLVVVVRIKTPPLGDALYHLAEKFGAEIDEAIALLKEAQTRGFKTGISFHVGSQCQDPGAYVHALEMVGQVIEGAKAEPVCLDVGGGFPVQYCNSQTPPLDDYMTAIRDGLKALALNPTVEIFAEPGRALVATGCSLLVQVQLRKDKRLYINDGIYGSLSELVQGGIELPARLIRLDGKVADAAESYTLNGPTCDSLDVLPGTFALPADVREGDWIEIGNVGAYSNAMATRFNGFHPETFVEIHEADTAD